MVDDPQVYPEADRNGTLPHPRETSVLFGQEAAETAFLDAVRSGRMHHAWALNGPKGVGKATLAWRIARYLLAGDLTADTLQMEPGHPVFRHAAALSEPRLALLRRPWDMDKKRLKTAITVDEVRSLRGFFSLSSTDGGWRVAIVDAADELNLNAANALLKSLEEPPARTAFLLVCHQPGRLLPTIRSRCRALSCASLPPEPLTQALEAAGLEAAQDPVALAELSGGSPGQAAELLDMEGLPLYGEIMELLSSLPGLIRPKALALGEACAGRGAEVRYSLTRRLISLALTRMARQGATGQAAPQAAPGEAETFARLSPTPSAARAWAELAQQLEARASHAAAVNVDPASVILDTLLALEKQAQTLR